MIIYLPEIYPDELVYSWFCRYYIHSGYFSHKDAMSELYCKRSDNPSKEFIGNLNLEARRVIESMYSIDELVLNHTMFPQYPRFIPLEQRKEAVYRLIHKSCDIHRLFCVLPRGEGEQFLRFCPMCVREDREKYFESYWHRGHQIRNMLICTKHKCRLKESDVVAKSEQTFTFSPAEYHICDCDIDHIDNSLLIEFAEYMEIVFDTSLDWCNEVPISSILYHGLSRTQYISRSGRTKSVKKLAIDMQVYYENMGLPNIASIHQIQRVFMGEVNDFSIVCQIAFFLGITVEELIAPSLTIEQIRQEQNSHYMRGSVPIDWKRLDEKVVPAVARFINGIYSGEHNSDGRPERVSERVIYREFNLSEHRLKNMPQCKAVFDKYAESYSETWARKIIWGYHKLKAERSTQIYWSDIRKLSGVKKCNMDAIIPYLIKHTDSETFNAIMALIDNDKCKTKEI